MKKSDNGPEVHCAFDKLVLIGELKPHPRNPNTHPPRQIELLAKIIREQGWRAPITVSERSGFIVRGHGRLLAARAAGLTTVPVDFQAYDSEAAELADLVADNKIAELAIIDDDILADLIGDLGQTEIDMELTGFDAAGVESLLADHGDELPDIDLGDGTIQTKESLENSTVFYPRTAKIEVKKALRDLMARYGGSVR